VQVVVSGEFSLFFASQTLHNRIFFKKKSGDVNYEANFCIFFFAS
jgi:hypothetical protein